MSLKPLLFTGVFRNEPFETVVKAAASIGYCGVEIRALSHLPADMSTQDVREMKQQLDDHGLVAPAIYLPNGAYLSESAEQSRRTLAQLETYAEFARELGASMILHKANSPAPREATEDDFVRCADWMVQAADRLHRAGLQLVWEMHHNSLTETIDSCLRLLRLVNRPNVGLALDPGNLSIAGEHYGQEAVDRLGDYIRHVHAKDIVFFAEKPAHRPSARYRGRLFAVERMGQGEVDHRPAYHALLERGYDGYVTLEAQVAGVTPEQIAKHEYRMLLGQLQP